MSVCAWCEEEIADGEFCDMACREAWWIDVRELHHDPS